MWWGGHSRAAVATVGGFCPPPPPLSSSRVRKRQVWLCGSNEPGREEGEVLWAAVTSRLAQTLNLHWVDSPQHGKRQSHHASPKPLTSTGWTAPSMARGSHITPRPNP
ncbi:hypothetical protein ACOMHN_038643 [Nucella lapillus]